MLEPRGLYRTDGKLPDGVTMMVYALFAESQFAESHFAESHFAESHFAESMGHFAEFFLAKWASKFGKVGKAVVYICKNRPLKL